MRDSTDSSDRAQTIDVTRQTAGQMAISVAEALAWSAVTCLLEASRDLDRGGDAQGANELNLIACELERAARRIGQLTLVKATLVNAQKEQESSAGEGRQEGRGVVWPPRRVPGPRAVMSLCLEVIRASGSLTVGALASRVADAGGYSAGAVTEALGALEKVGAVSVTGTGPAAMVSLGVARSGGR